MNDRMYQKLFTKFHSVDVLLKNSEHSCSCRPLDADNDQIKELLVHNQSYRMLTYSNFPNQVIKII